MTSEKRSRRPLTASTTNPRARGMNVDLAFGGLVAARLLLAFAPLPDQLKYDHLLSSPLTSNLRCNRLPQRLDSNLVDVSLLGKLQYTKGSISSRMGLTRIPEAYFTRFDRETCLQSTLLSTTMFSLSLLSPL